MLKRWTMWYPRPAASACQAASPVALSAASVGVLAVCVALSGGAALLTSCGGKTEPVRPDVILVTIDALRADHLGCYGYRLDTSPVMDRIAERGVRFTDCMVQWPKTSPSIGSLLTGEYPMTRDLWIRWKVYPESFAVLSQLFREAGYATGAVVSNINIGKKHGFHRGFDTFIESWKVDWVLDACGGPFDKDSARIKDYLNATIVTDLALQWLEGLPRDKPVFLWIHYMDPHGPYTPPERYKGYFAGEHPPEPVALDKLPSYQVQYDPSSGAPITDLAHYKTQYDREIRYVDEELGRFLDSLPGSGPDRETLLVVTADHGESLGDHGYFLEHGLLPYQGCAHIPLILLQEGRLPAGKTVSHPVGLIDLTPTLLELAGLEVPLVHEGMSLAGLIRGEQDAFSGPPDFVFMQSGYQLAQLQGTVREGRWKLIHVPSPGDRSGMTGAEYELYDVLADPEERHNIAESHPEVVKRLSRALERWSAQPARVRIPEERLKEIETGGLDPDAVKMLEALGYAK